MKRYRNTPFHGHALNLLPLQPTASADAVARDTMYRTSKNCWCDWYVDAAGGADRVDTAARIALTNPLSVLDAIALADIVAL